MYLFWSQLGGTYSAPPDTLAGFQGPTSKKGKREKEKEYGKRRKENKERGIPTPQAKIRLSV